jgi:hypothetical protein
MIIEHITVYKDENAYSCFPAITRDHTGKLWVSFRRAGGFSLEALRRGKYDHVDKGARIALASSTDEGKTWSVAHLFPSFDPECGEQDPSITTLRSGELLINFFRWHVVPENEKYRLPYPVRQQYDGSIADVEGPLVIRSYDNGLTWEKHPRLVASSPLPRAGTSDAVLELPDGTLLMGIYGADFGSGVCRAYTVCSIDGGYTWSQPALIARDPQGKVSFEEPALVRLPDGRLMAILRSGEPGNYQYLHQSFSEDNGHVWSSPEQTPMWGHPAHVLLLPGGELVCTYGYRRPPYGIRACISRDNGKTWEIEREVVLRDDGGSRDLGYPCTCLLQDGTLLTVYYIHGEDGIRHIASTRWSLD